MDIVIHRFIRDGKYYQIKMHLPVLKELDSISDPTEKARILALIEKAVQKLPLFSTLPPGSTQTDIQNSLARLPAAEAKKIRATLLSTATHTVKTYQAQFFKATAHPPSVTAAARVKEASSASPVSPPSPPRGGGAAAAAGIGIARDRRASPIAPSTAYAGAAVAGPISFSAPPPALSFESTIPEYTHLLETWRARYTQALPNTASMQDKIEALSAALDKISSPTDREEIFNRMASDFMSYLKKPGALLEMIPSNWGHILEILHYIHPDRPKDAFEMLAVLHPLLKKTPEFLRNLDIFVATKDGCEELVSRAAKLMLEALTAESISAINSGPPSRSKGRDRAMASDCLVPPAKIASATYNFYINFQNALKRDSLEKPPFYLDSTCAVSDEGATDWKSLKGAAYDHFLTAPIELLGVRDYRELVGLVNATPKDMNRIKEELRRVIPPLQADLALGRNARGQGHAESKIALTESRLAIAALNKALSATTEAAFFDSLNEAFLQLAIRKTKRSCAKDFERQLSPLIREPEAAPFWAKAGDDYSRYEKILDNLCPPTLPASTRFKVLQCLHQGLVAMIILADPPTSPEVMLGTTTRFHCSVEKTQSDLFVIRATATPYFLDTSDPTKYQQAAAISTIITIPFDETRRHDVLLKKEPFLLNPFGADAVYAAIYGPGNMWIL